MVKDDIRGVLEAFGVERFKDRLLGDFKIGETAQEGLITSLLSGHHILIVGPPGSGKTTLANRIANILNDIEVVEGCPLNCLPGDARCPWCLDRQARGIPQASGVLKGSKRIKKVQGSGGLVKEDLIGDIDVGTALAEGVRSTRAFVPGKLLRANHGILLIDFIDKVPEKTLNSVLYPIQGDPIDIGFMDRALSLDVLVIGTAEDAILDQLPLDMADCFDVVTLGYPDDPASQREIIMSTLSEAGIEEAAIDEVIDIVNRTRTHPEVKRGVSTRGMIRYASLLSSSAGGSHAEQKQALRSCAQMSLPHRLGMSLEADTPGKRDEIINEIVADALGETKQEEIVSLSREAIEDLVEELVREDSFRMPLKYGAFDLLLRRVQRLPESQLAGMHNEMMRRLIELYPERYGILTPELLNEIEETRKKHQDLMKKLEIDAFSETIATLQRRGILENRNEDGWGLSQKGISFLLEALAPKLFVDKYSHGYGRHSTGKKSAIGEGKIIGIRHFQTGDRYRDISLRDTIREALRKRHEELTREDIKVVTSDIRTRMNIVLVMDLSGTMRQLDKLWYAKQSAIALTLAASYYKDNIGVVTFSNLAEVMSGLSGNVHEITRKILALELHENAFTNIGYAMNKAISLLAHYPKGKAKRHIILISDGYATAPHPSPEKYALRQVAAASRRGISISSICIAQQSADPDLMRKIAKMGRGRSYFVGADELTTAMLEETTHLHAA